MPSFMSTVRSSVGKKFLMAITGLAMIVFLIEHLTGNFLLLQPNPEPYNKYAHFLLSFGWLLIVAELILVAFLVIHMVSGISVFLKKRQARPVGYHVTGSAGKPSKKSFASTTMIYTGIVIFIFLAIHLKTFKYGPYYETTVDGVVMRDLYRLVNEVFSDPLYVGGYVVAMILLGFHLRHGFWSAFQSLGLNHPRYMPIIYGLGVLIAIVLAVGFLGIPVWIYLREVVL